MMYLGEACDSKQAREILTSSRRLSNAPISKFSIAALVRNSFGLGFLGVNWETPNRKLGACAESAAITNSVSLHGAAPITDLWIMGENESCASSDRVFPPCAACLQLLSELGDDNTKIILLSLSGSASSCFTLKELFPQRFTFSRYTEIFSNMDRSEAKMPTSNIQRQLELAYQRSFSPDNAPRQGAILTTGRGSCFPGSMFNTANFRQTTTALEASISAMIALSGRDTVKHAYLMVEAKPEAQIESKVSALDMELLSFFNCPLISVSNDSGNVLFEGKPDEL